jgi:hypothetical protein
VDGVERAAVRPARPSRPRTWSGPCRGSGPTRLPRSTTVRRSKPSSGTCNRPGASLPIRRSTASRSRSQRSARRDPPSRPTERVRRVSRAPRSGPLAKRQRPAATNHDARRLRPPPASPRAQVLHARGRTAREGVDVDAVEELRAGMPVGDPRTRVAPSSVRVHGAHDRAVHTFRDRVRRRDLDLRETRSP